MHFSSCLLFFSACFILVLGSAYSKKHDALETIGIPWSGHPGLTESVVRLIGRESIRPTPLIVRHRIKPSYFSFHKFFQNPSAPGVSHWPAINIPATSMEPRAILSPQAV